MIYGNVNNKLFDINLKILPGPLANALKFLKDNDLTKYPAGNSEINLNGVKMILQVIDMKTNLRENLRPEIHRKNIDVQFLCSGGSEVVAYYNDDGTGIIDEDLLSTQRDILFYENEPDKFINEGKIFMTPGTFAIYFPYDVHVPGIAFKNIPAEIRKIVIKVPLDSCVK